MDFRNHPSSQDLSQHHFSDHHNLTDTASIPRTLFPDHIGHSSTPDSAGNPPPQQTGVGPTWLNSAILQQQSQFLNLQRTPETTPSQLPQGTGNNQWLSRSSVLQRNVSDVNGSMIGAGVSNESGDLGKDYGGSSGGGGGGEYKAEILSHPLYDQLLSAHVACLRIATPVDQLLRIDAQLAQSQQVVAKYSAVSHGNVGGDKELDQFMTHYVLLLCSFKEQLQQHVRVHAMEAVMACWEIEQSLQSLTGVSAGEGTGATMSDDDDDQVDSDTNLFDGSLEGPDNMGFGPLVLTESEKSLMERGYKEKIVDIREEILRKRRAGKLPGDTTSVLKAWWQSHAKWPYPTEEDKAKLVQETGLQLKQINNWFINQRKRNWHSNASTSTVLKSKRKRGDEDRTIDYATLKVRAEDFICKFNLKDI
ncbi:hypothetical protein RHGRI_005587 [Rhododendron griersonianum]|uniref:Homeobox domain-containing protein n=1 Tax=Rhododendron griersonianum TaxID=479676 RepID=A0AAV6LCU7_9ERIC|nr:hypothetical protein RHGRI_005587 [Rhododendron griersonianum]